MNHWNTSYTLLCSLIIISIIGLLVFGCTDSKYKFRETGQVTEYYFKIDSLVDSSKTLLKGRAIYPVKIGQSVKDLKHFVYKEIEHEEGSFWFMFAFFDESFDSVYYNGEICYLEGFKT